MWRLYEVAQKARENASGYMSTVQEKAHSIVASVQDEANYLLTTLASARTGPVDDLLYEEIQDYKKFTEKFNLDEKTEEITKVCISAVY